MGGSAPPPASINLIGSYARVRGADVEMVLWAPTQAENAASCLLARGSVRVPGSVDLVEDEQGRRLVAQVPRSALGDGQWTIRLVLPDGEGSKVEARLLVQGSRPVVLLWGGTRPQSEVPRAASTRKRVVRRGGRALDSALKVLPPETAMTVRASLRRTARRLVH